MADPSPPTGLFLVYEPKNQEPAVDIVIIHGLKGHAYKTWTSPLMPDAVVDLTTEVRSDGKASAPKREQVLRSVTTLMKWASGKRGPSKVPTPEMPEPTLFWPRDLLPQDCPNARILTYGYDTKITKYTSGSTSKNSVLSHSKDFLFALGRSHAKDCPLIFLAHSLGGIVVKEMLALSSTSPTDELCNIVSSTAAVIFLGTPHRGSPDLSALGAWAKSVLSGLRFQTNSAILDTLGLKTTDLERSQEAFSGLWSKHDFRVKTFQEGYPMTKINLGVLGNKVVPDTSSLIGDQRERTETLQANHMKMCRFSGREDANFVKVVGELRSVYLTVLTGKTHDPSTGQPAAFNPVISNANGHEELTAQQAACLKSLQFPCMHRRRQLIEDPAPQTGRWLIENETYSHWLMDRDRRERPCILLLKGEPGAGKSTLMKQAFRHAKLSLPCSEYCVAGIFVSAAGEPLEHSSIGVFRSLLHQLLPHYPIQLQEAVQFWTVLEEEARMNKHAEVIWSSSVLETLLNSIFGHAAGKKTIIFIDGLDELGINASVSRAELWGKLSERDKNGRVRVCLSSRHYPHVSFSSVSELVAENLNGDDISTYIDQRLSARITRPESHWKHQLQTKITDNAMGIFLWVTLTMDSLLVKYDQGKSLELLTRDIHSIPWELESLFTEIVTSISPVTHMVSLRAFQWALMSTTPLRLHQWRHVLAFIKTPVPKSLKEWSGSVNCTESDNQLEREIKALSGGLLQVSATRSDEGPLEDEDSLSIRAGAGSLDQEQGETRIVQVIHESVREFFLNGDGFRSFGMSAAFDAVGNCHSTIVITCLDYICISKLDDLVDARRASQGQEAIPLPEWAELDITGPANEFHSIHEEKNLAEDSTNGRQELFAEHLSMIPMSDLRTNVARWIGAGNVSANPVSSTASSQCADSILSAAKVSCQLGGWPSLLFYITSNLATHIREAKKSNVCSDELRRRLEDKNIRARFALLNEDVAWDTPVPLALPIILPVYTRSALTLGTPAPCLTNETPMPEPIHGQGDISPTHSTRARSHFSRHEERALSRTGSVASFSSASSYATNRGKPSDYSGGSKPPHPTAISVFKRLKID